MSIFSRALSFVRREPQPPVYIGGIKATDLLTMVMGWGNTAPTYSARNYETFMREGYHKNELIFACIDAKGNTAASAELCIKDKNTGEEIDDHPIRELMKQPNPLMSGFDFWYFTIANLDIAGVAYWQKIRNNANQVIALWPMRPDWVSIKEDRQKVIGGYEYRPPGASNPVIFDVRDVLVFRQHDPGNLLGVTSRVQIAARAADIDNAETDMIRKIWESGGVPLGLLTSKLKLTDGDVEAIRKRWAQRYGGSQNWHIPAVLDSDATYQRMQMNFAEMGLEFLDGRDETRICMVMGVPPIIVGTTYGLSRSTFSNYAEARRAWWEDSLVPQYKKLSDTFNAQLLAEVDSSAIAEWDFDNVPALRENEDAKWQRATAALTAGGITVNMFLEAIGQENIGAEGEYFLRSSAIVPVPVGSALDDGSAEVTDDDEEEPEKPLSQPAKDELAKFAAYVHQVKHEQKAINPRNPSGYEDFLFIHTPKGARLAAKAYADIADVHELEAVYSGREYKAEQRVSITGMPDAMANEKNAAEAVMFDAVTAYFEKLKARVIQNTRQAATHARKASLIPGDLQDYLNYFDDKFWLDMFDLLDRSLRPQMQDMVTKGAEFGAKRITAKMGMGFDPAVFNTDAAAYAMKYTDRVLQKFNTTTRDGVGAVLARWVGSEGATMQDLVNAFEQSPLFALPRAQMTAITESTRAFSQGEMMAGEELAAMAGVPFRAKGSGLEPPLHPNCRCWLTTDPVYNEKNELVAFDVMYHTARDIATCPVCAPYNETFLGGAV